jgi:hypothetical protein
MVDSRLTGEWLPELRFSLQLVLTRGLLPGAPGLLLLNRRIKSELIRDMFHIVDPTAPFDDPPKAAAEGNHSTL